MVLLPSNGAVLYDAHVETDLADGNSPLLSVASHRDAKIGVLEYLEC